MGMGQEHLGRLAGLMKKPVFSKKKTGIDSLMGNQAITGSTSTE